MVAKKALLVGNNYPGTKAELKGCINDVFIMKDILMRVKGFEEESIKILIDTDSSYEQPTGENIRRELAKMCKEAEPGDYIFMHFSGHGTQVPGMEEDDFKNEAICPTDMNLIVDDDLRDIANACKEGVNFTLLTDCCHSGGMLDHREIRITGDKKKDPDAVPPEYAGRELPIESVCSILSQQLGKLVEPHGVRGALSEKYGAAASKFAVGMWENYSGKKMNSKQKQQIGAFLTSCFAKLGVDGDNQHNASAGAGGSGGGSAADKPPRPANVPSEIGILITGCQGHETSADVRAGGTAYGALTKNIEKALEKNPNANFYELVHLARDGLAEGGFTQNPCLECSEENARLPFICPSV